MSEPFIGEIRMFGGNFAPQGWALCDGQLLAISDNDALFALIGTTYGGDGETTFALPDLRGRLPVHMGQGSGLSNYVQGQTGGTETVTLTTSQLPLHTHPLSGSNTQATTRSPANTGLNTAEAQVYSRTLDAGNLSGDSIGPAGGSQPHENVMPFMCINFIIALFGIFPSRN